MFNPHEDSFRRFYVKLLTDRQTDRQTDRRTDRQTDRETNAKYYITSLVELNIL